MAHDRPFGLDRRQIMTAVPAAGPLFLAAAAGPARAAEPARANGIPAIGLGVVPDLAEDQTDRLQAAIDAAAAQRLPLILPPGTVLAAGLVLRPGSAIVGAGPESRIALTKSGRLVWGEALGHARLADFTCYGGPVGHGSGPAEPLAAFTDVDDLRLTGLTVSAAPGRGLDLRRCGGRVASCAIAGARDTALFAIDSTGLAIADNLVEDCGNNAIQVWRSRAGEDGTIVSGNRIRRIRADDGGSGQYGNAINIFRAGGVIVQTNRIEDCAYSAVRSNAGSNCQIIGNSCLRLGEVALYAEFGFEGAIVASNLVDDAASGVAITNFNEGGRLAVCSGNIIRNLHRRDHYDARGTGIGAEADTVITGNVIENAPAAGISVGWGRHLRNVSVTSNVVRNCGVGISVSVTAGAGPALVAGNLIADSAVAAIQGFDHSDAVGGDLIDQPDRWPHVTLSGNVRA